MKVCDHCGLVAAHAFVGFPHSGCPGTFRQLPWYRVLWKKVFSRRWDEAETKRLARRLSSASLDAVRPPPIPMDLTVFGGRTEPTYLQVDQNGKLLLTPNAVARLTAEQAQRVANEIWLRFRIVGMWHCQRCGMYSRPGHRCPVCRGTFKEEG